MAAPESFRPEIVGSFSTGAAANPTGAMMNAAFAAENLNWLYVNCEVRPEDLHFAVTGAQAMGWRGFNCSMPHKQRVIDHLDDLSTTAQICDAVNCVVRSQGQWVGHNTDGVGFVDSVRNLIDLPSSNALLIGSGGAAHAIAVELARSGTRHIEILSRNRTSGQRLADLIVSRTPASAVSGELHGPVEIDESVQMVVNATPVGMAPRAEQMIEVRLESLRPDLLVADVVPNPATTRLLTVARRSGATVVDGRRMLVHQAAANHRLWTGRDPQLSVLESALEAALTADD